MIRPHAPPSLADVAAHYDELDVAYREVWGEHVHHGLWLRGDETPEEAVRQLVERVAQGLALRPGAEVCDVGCGYGATARYLAATHGACVTGLTLSAAQHAYATAHPERDGTTVWHRDWLANGLPAGAFDAVISLECFSHVPEPARFFAEIARVLRPGGRLGLCVWLASEAAAPWQHRHLLRPICRDGRLAHLATAPEVRALLADAGLHLDGHEDLSRAVASTWTHIGRRVLGQLLTEARFRRFVWQAQRRDRVFLWTLPRLWLGYRTGALRYGYFAAHKPVAS